LNKAFLALTERYRDNSLLRSCRQLLAWDMRTMMPAAAGPYRASQLATLERMAHTDLISAEFAELLANAESEAKTSVDPDAAVNLREIRRVYERAVRLPSSFVGTLAHAQAVSQSSWEEARRQNDDKDFLPHLETMVALKREEAALIGPGQNPYDVLYEDYEPGATAGTTAPLFQELRDALVPLLARIKDAKRRPPMDLLHGHFPVEAQRQLSVRMATQIGFDFARGRLDTTVHPFCITTGPNDRRLTTRFDEGYLGAGLFATLHEAGHGIYELGLPPGQFGLPLGLAASSGIHESQSRLWENMVGRSRAFCEYALPIIAEVFPDAMKGVGAETFYFSVNGVNPSLIRVEADEVSYNLHIILRFELEQALLAGELQVSDLEAVWNERFCEYFGFRPGSKSVGYLQDVHWSMGLFGYFPTYALGNLYAASFMAAAEKELGEMQSSFRRGDFAGLRAWLGRHIHSEGRRYRPAALCEKVTGASLSAKPFIRYLEAKYSELYQI